MIIEALADVAGMLAVGRYICERPVFYCDKLYVRFAYEVNQQRRVNIDQFIYRF